MELRKIYDGEGKYQGYKKDRSEPLLPGEYYRVAGVFTLDERKLLITQRAAGKTFPHEWEITVGSIIEEETPLTGACRELAEEVGIETVEENLLSIDVMKEDDKFCHLYILRTENTPTIILQEEEVESYKWVDYEALREMMTSHQFACPMERRIYRHLPLLKSYMCL